MHFLVPKNKPLRILLMLLLSLQHRLSLNWSPWAMNCISISLITQCSWFTIRKKVIFEEISEACKFSFFARLFIHLRISSCQSNTVFGINVGGTLFFPKVCKNWPLVARNHIFTRLCNPFRSQFQLILATTFTLILARGLHHDAPCHDLLSKVLTTDLSPLKFLIMSLSTPWVNPWKIGQLSN